MVSHWSTSGHSLTYHWSVNGQPMMPSLQIELTAEQMADLRAFAKARRQTMKGLLLDWFQQAKTEEEEGLGVGEPMTGGAELLSESRRQSALLTEIVELLRDQGGQTQASQGLASSGGDLPSRPSWAPTAEEIAAAEAASKRVGFPELLKMGPMPTRPSWNDELEMEVG